ncbi:MAG TPA: hypothetical protein DCW90_23125 [Lachnospiraceae bacterium]|nr:hypothetical protein [Lachnospiraceae bacterium]
MLNCGIIGVGNAGNQVVSYAEQEKAPFKLFAINCSAEDLKSIPESINRALIGDGRGAGKNRVNSKTSLAKDIMPLIMSDEFKEFMIGLDFLFICSSTGGGTGSGASLVMTSVINNVYPTVYTINVGIMNCIKDALSTQSNTLEYLHELYEVMSEPTYMLYDNDKFGSLPINKMMDTVNRQIVEDLTVLTGQYNTNTRFTSMDDKDTINLLKTPGRIVVSQIKNFKEKDINENGIENMLLENIRKGAHVDLQKDRIVSYFGIIYNMSQEVADNFDFGLPKIQQEVGVPLDTWQHLVINEDSKLPNSVFIIFTGLTKINDRIDKINDRLKEIMDRQKQKEDDDTLNEFNINELNAKKAYKETTVSGKPQKVDLNDIFAKFGVTSGSDI